MRIGLTGGIGSGKSTVAELFSRFGVPIVDADEVSRKIVAPGLPAYNEIVATFGRDILTLSGEVDRRRLRDRVFQSPADRAKLEAILHPRIRTEMSNECARVTAPYCLMVIPLLIETGQYVDVDRVLVVDALPERQVERVMARSGLRQDEVRRILDAQVSREARRAHADDVIENNGDIDQLTAAVSRLHQHYLQLAKGSVA